jgi:pimeloyl-ACP methyl ester carboxylesterase
LFWNKLGYPRLGKTAGVETLVLDQHSAVTYKLIGAVAEGGCQKLIIFAHDIFDSFMEYSALLEALAEHTLVPVLAFNLPGQAYTAFSRQSQSNNITHAEVLDRILYELQEEGRIMDHTKFYLIGVGYGALLLHTLYLSANFAVRGFEQLLYFNFFAEVSAAMKSILSVAMETYLSHQSSPVTTLPFHFHSTLANSRMLSPQELLDKSRANPLKLSGRILLLKALLQSVRVEEYMSELATPLMLVMSHKNTFYQPYRAGPDHRPKAPCAVL